MQIVLFCAFLRLCRKPQADWKEECNLCLFAQVLFRDGASLCVVVIIEILTSAVFYFAPEGSLAKIRGQGGGRRRIHHHQYQGERSQLNLLCPWSDSALTKNDLKPNYWCNSLCSIVYLSWEGHYSLQEKFQSIKCSILQSDDKSADQQTASWSWRSCNWNRWCIVRRSVRCVHLGIRIRNEHRSMHGMTLTKESL